MKKLFTVLVASVCGTMAYAQSGAISVNDVTVMKGATTQVEVAINDAANMTAFQFDLAVPAGFSVTDAKLNGEYGESRHLLNGEVGGKLRFLSYDDGNAKLQDGEKVIVTLKATEEAETATLKGDGIVVVDPEGNSIGAEDLASASINVSEGVQIKITSALQALVCSDKNLDFSTVPEVKAYIATGYDKVSGKIYLTRVKDVPAKTAVLLMGDAGTYTIPTAAECKNIYQNLFVGTLTEKIVKKDEGDGNTNYILSKVGDEVGFYFAKESGSTIKAGGGWLPLPTTIAAVGTAGSTESIDMNKYGMLCYYSDQSLDFTDETDLKAYTATGYDKKGIIRLTRVKQVPANTAMLLLAPAEKKTYTVPTASLQQIHANMFVGTLEGTTIYRLTEDNNYVNYYMSVVNGEAGFYWAAENGTSGTKIGAKRGWLPVPKEMTSLAATSRGENPGVLSMSLTDDVIVLSVFGSGDDDATGISRIAAEAGNDTWYNLSGQRIDKPTRKGLYIKNGIKVIVK